MTRRLLIIVAENLFEDHDDVAHEIHRVVKHNHLPKRRELVLITKVYVKFGKGARVGKRGIHVGGTY